MPAGGQGDAGVAADGEHVADAALAQERAQGGVGAIHLVAGHPVGGHAGVERGAHHLLGQLGLGGEGDLVGDAGGGPPLGVVAPRGPRQVEPPVDQRPPAWGGVGQEHRDLAVFDPAGGAGVLPLDAHRAGALLQEARLVDDENPVGVAEPVGDECPHEVAGLVLVPDR